MRNIIFAGCLAALSVLGVQTAQAQGTIKIGAVTPNAGPMAPTGVDLARSYELAIDWVNANGGLLGKQVVLVRGDASNAQEGIAAVDSLVGREKVDFFVGTIITAISNAASETALNHNKLYWETNALSIDLTNRKLPNFLRSGPSGNNFAKTSVDGTIDLIAKKLGKAPKDIKVWVEHEDSAYGTSIAKEQERLFKQAGVQVTVGAHSAKSVDLSDSILRAKQFAPDVWLNAGYIQDINLLLRTARDQGFKPGAIMLLGLGDTVETLDALGKDYLEGILVVVYPKTEVNPKFGPGAKEFYDNYVKKYGTPPLASSGMNGFVGLKIAFEAIKAAGSTDYEKVIKAAKAMKKPVGSYETGYGIEFDDTMQNLLALPIIVQWQDGKVRPVYPIAAMPEGVSLVSLERK